VQTIQAFTSAVVKRVARQSRKDGGSILSLPSTPSPLHIKPSHAGGNKDHSVRAGAAGDMDARFRLAKQAIARYKAGKEVSQAERSY